MANSIYGRFADQNSEVLTGQIASSNNNQISLNAAIAENDHLRSKNVALQPVGLTITPGELVPNVTGVVQNTIGAALGDIGQAGTASQEPGGGGIPCPTLTQFVIIRSEMGTPIPTLVKYVELGMYLWSPRTKDFERIIRADIVDNQNLWALQTDETIAEGSEYHPVIRSPIDTTGKPLGECGDVTSCMVVVELDECQMVLDVVDLETKGSVMHLETEGPSHIYAAGSDPETLVEWHNLKPQEPGP